MMSPLLKKNTQGILFLSSCTVLLNTNIYFNKGPYKLIRYLKIKIDKESEMYS